MDSPEVHGKPSHAALVSHCDVVDNASHTSSN